jgi:signal transduction histidine kinase
VIEQRAPGDTRDPLGARSREPGVLAGRRRSPEALIRRARAWLRAHPLAADVLLTVLMVAVAISGFASLEASEEGLGGSREPDGWGVLLLVLMNAPLVLRRRAPLAVLGVVLAAGATFWVLDYPDSTGTFGVLLAVYTVGNRCARRRSLIGLAVALGVILCITTAGVLSEDVDLPPSIIVANVIIFLAAWLWGDGVRSRRAYLAELELRAETAEREQRSEAQRAVQEERARIARELHDVVAHSMSVMVVQAAGARRLLAADPAVDHSSTARATEAMGHIEQTGREAMGEMRRLLGVLRSEGDEAELAPQPGLGDLPALVGSWREAGLPVELRVVGAVDDLPPGVDLCAYRVIQEALTNTSRHAGQARARVEVVRADDALEVVVSDDGRGAAAAADGHTPGHGIGGMRERTALYGGTVQAGPRTGGGFEVRASLPLA